MNIDVTSTSSSLWVCDCDGSKIQIVQKEQQQIKETKMAGNGFEQGMNEII